MVREDVDQDLGGGHACNQRLIRCVKFTPGPGKIGKHDVSMREQSESQDVGAGPL